MVDIVRYAADEGAAGLQLLRFAQVRFQRSAGGGLFARGDVATEGLILIYIDYQNTYYRT